MSILAFQIPEKVVMEKSDDFHGTFEFKPLERGFGVTIGNSIRRILLSSLEGHAIVGIKIPSVLHEFTSIPGVVEDVTDIILNLKMVRFKKVTDSPEGRILVSLKKKEVFCAGDIAAFTSDYQILNPDLVICHIDSNVDFHIELNMGKGRGYVSSEENRLADQPIGYIPIDSIFTPIRNVSYTVENTRVEQKTDYEKLILDIHTDGSIHPETALKSAASILIQHFMLFSDQNITLHSEVKFEEEPIDEEFIRMRKLLKTSLADLDLSVRAYNCLKAAEVKTLGDLVSLEISDMIKFRNFGKKSLTELEALVTDLGLTFGFDTVKYKLDED
jgi:DNA-directed RNA polymerase subunit alpha